MRSDGDEKTPVLGLCYGLLLFYGHVYWLQTQIGGQKYVKLF